MATLTLISQPPVMASAHGGMCYQVKASPAADVEQVLLMLFNMNPFVPITQWAQKPDYGTTDTYTFFVEQVVQDQLGYDLHPPTETGAQPAPQSSITIAANFMGQKYDATLGQFANTSTPISTDEVMALNSCFQADEVPDLAPWIMDGTAPKRFLSNGPLAKDVNLTDSEWLSGIVEVPSGTVSAIVQRYTPGNPTPLVKFIDLTPLFAQKRFDIGIGPANLNFLFPGYLDETHTHYEVIVVHSPPAGGLVAVSEKRRYNLVKTCAEAPTRLHFLNRLGAIDSYTLTGSERRSIKTGSTVYQKLRPPEFRPSARGRKVLQKEATVRLSCSTDALRPDEMLWLEELITSPAIYVQRGQHHIPVTLRDGDFEILDPVKNIHRLRLELEYAHDMVLQRG